jgi:O-antigen ligase
MRLPPSCAAALIGGLAILLVVPGLREYATAAKWSFLAVSVALAVCFVEVRMTKCHWIGLWLLVWATLTLLWAPVTVDALQGLAWLFVLAGAFVLGSAASSMAPLYTVAGFALLPSLIGLFLVRFFGLHIPLVNIDSTAGTFGNSNFAGEAAALIASSGLAATKLRKNIPNFIPLAVLGLSLCRGGLVGFGLMGAIRLWRVSRLSVVALALIAAFALGLTLENAAKREAIVQRTLIWRDAFDGLTVLGRGVGQYRAVVPEYGHRLSALSLNTEHAHNDALEVAFELGLPGLVLLVWFFATAIRQGMAAERYVLGSALVAGLFGFPLFEPVTGFLIAVVAGHCARARVCLRDDVDECASDAVPSPERVAAALGLRPAASGGVCVPAGLAGATGGGGRGDPVGALPAAGLGAGRD